MVVSFFYKSRAIDSKNFYYLGQHIQNNILTLYNASEKSYYATPVDTEVLKFGITGSNLWYVKYNYLTYLFEKKPTLMYFSIGKNKPVQAKFPHYLKPLDYHIFYLTNSEIFVFVTNETKNIYLYSASVFDLKFSKIAGVISSNYNKYNESCIYIECFERLPGIFIANQENIINKKIIKFTAISFNRGSRWYHLKVQSLLDGRLCDWPSCYLKLELRCSNTLEKNSITYDKRCPNLMASYGSIYRENMLEYSGVFISTDSGFTWKASANVALQITNYSLLVYIINLSVFKEKVVFYMSGNIMPFVGVLSKNCRLLYLVIARVWKMTLAVPLATTAKTENVSKIQTLIQMKKLMNFSDDSCLENNDWKDQTAYICKLTIGSTIQYIALNNISHPNFAKIPLTLSPRGFTRSYGFNLNKNCLYTLDMEGIREWCYNTRTQAFKNFGESLLNDSRFRVDDTSGNIFYFDKNNIFIFDVKSKYKKKLMESVDDISYINIFPHLGKLIYFHECIYNGLTKFAVSMISTNGKFQYAFYHDYPVSAVMYNTNRENFIIFSKGQLVRVNLKMDPIETRELNMPDIVEAYFQNNQEYYVTTKGIYVGNKMTFHGIIKYGYFHISQTEDELERPHACRFAHCDIFCFPLSNDKYECGCPDTMIFDPKISACVFDSQHPNNFDCKTTEYKCSNKKCVPIESICNYFDDCGDNSDEKNCNIRKCDADAVLCDNESKCIEYAKICDGILDCLDQKDEKDCPESAYCNKMEFKCLNDRCIPREKFCDGVDDCLDFSDEVSCDSSWKTYNTSNVSCMIKCDGKCISNLSLCNHITDCLDGSDEQDCGYEFKCMNLKNHKCKSDFICVDSSKICDGFDDCPDGSDELNCPNILCPSKKKFKCHSTDMCISINKVCNNNFDCEDHSDEVNNIHLNYLELSKMNEGSVIFKWKANRKSNAVIYDISLLDECVEHAYKFRIANKYLKDKFTKNKSIKLDIFEICKRYEFIVTPFPAEIGKYLQFTYTPHDFKEPTRLFYNYSNNMMNWSFTKYPCIPVTFFVSSCPMDVFNLSCSIFSETIILNEYSPRDKKKLYSIIMLSLTFILGFVTFLLYKVKRSKSTPNYLNQDSKLRFTQNSTSQITESKLFVSLSQ
ncbi:LOW QUALITY PROTEIN: hypothetical protein MXB_922 [Myxobolus squamalis]|nr:LOW QUALITY PROTEIN: hypothetical protein MXB_922 [Myxobolus squamalis]